MSLISKLLKRETFEVMSDHKGLPSSYLNAISSPLLKGAKIIFSNATAEAVYILFFDSTIVWNDHSVSPVSKSTANKRLSAEIKYTMPLYIKGVDKIGKGIDFCQIISPEFELRAIIWPYPSTKMIVPSKYEIPPLIN